MAGRLGKLMTALAVLTVVTALGPVSRSKAGRDAVRPPASTCRLNLKDCRVIRTCRTRQVWKCRHGGVTAEGTRRCLPVRRTKRVCRCRVICQCPGQRPFAFSLNCPDAGRL